MTRHGQELGSLLSLLTKLSLDWSMAHASEEYEEEEKGLVTMGSTY